MEESTMGARILRRRKEKGLTQRELGERLHVTDRAVSKWETGKSFPDVSVLEDVCRELDISVSELLAGKRIASEDYKEETEKVLIATIGQRQLMGFEVVCSILKLLFIFLIISFCSERYISSKIKPDNHFFMEYGSYFRWLYDLYGS